MAPPATDKMKSMHKIAGTALVLLLAAAVYGIFRTTPPAVLSTGSVLSATGPSQGQPLVDQSALLTAQRLVRMRTNSPLRRKHSDWLTKRWIWRLPPPYARPPNIRRS